MYEAPKLERFGAFRDLTLQAPYGKNVVGDDLVPGVGLDCDGSASATPTTQCIRS